VKLKLKLVVNSLESDRSRDVSVFQSLHMLNSSHIQNKTMSSPLLKEVLRTKRDPFRRIDELYLHILSRFPTRAGWGDLFRGIACFKDMATKPLYEKVALDLGIPQFPLAISHADVCRHDLLFEIEVDAVKLAS